MNKITWGNIKNSLTPIRVIILIIISTVSITYYVINNLIIEHYKLEIHRLEKIIDQQTKIKNLDSISNSLRIILDEQIKISENKSIIKSKIQYQIPNMKKWENKIRESINFGKAILECDPSENRTFDLFNSWRNENLLILKQIDKELNKNFELNFNILTKINMSEYQQLRSKINDGIKLLKTIYIY